MHTEREKGATAVVENKERADLDKLEGALNIKEQITRTQARIDDLRAKCGGVTLGDKVKGGTQQEIAQTIVELTEKVEALKASFNLEQKIVERHLEKIIFESEMIKTIMMLRYVDCLNWESVIIKSCYSRRRTFELHAMGLKSALHRT